MKKMLDGIRSCGMMSSFVAFALLCLIFTLCAGITGSLAMTVLAVWQVFNCVFLVIFVDMKVLVRDTKTLNSELLDKLVIKEHEAERLTLELEECQAALLECKRKAAATTRKKDTPAKEEVQQVKAEDLKQQEKKPARRKPAPKKPVAKEVE